MSAPLFLTKLYRLVRRKRRPIHERCDLCGMALPDEHGHLVESASGRLACSCAGCLKRFPARGRARFRRIPDRVKRLSEFSRAGELWTGLGLPTPLAFFVHRSDLRQTLAVYPGPAGPVPAPIEPDVWRRTVARCPDLAHMEPDVEALLVHELGGTREAYLVPIDRCYQLVGRVKRRWKGRSGGDGVREEIGDFFSRLRASVEGVLHA